MNNLSLLAVEAIISGSLVYVGLSNRQFLWLTSARSAAITLGIVGAVFCTASIGKFILVAPAHPLTLCGYGIGTILLITMLCQIFGMKLPIVGKSEYALIIIGVGIILQGVIARFVNVLG